jgi:hypothetical protein
MRDSLLLEDEDFVRRRVWPLVSGGGEKRPPPAAFRVTLHRHRRDGRLVAAYCFEEAEQVFAKLYPDRVAGRGVHRITASLWSHGFGRGSPHRVPEPLGYLEEYGVLLMRPAAGDRFTGAAADELEALARGARRAARWLAALHASPLRLGPRVDAAHGALRLARRAAKAAASRPDLADLFRAALGELEQRLTAEPGPPVQTHGRFHAGHVFVAPRWVTVVDLDRACVADPAQDVGEFLHALRWEGAKRRWSDDAVEEACDAFLDAYSQQRPDPLTALTYYWSYSVLWALLGLAFRRRPGRTAWDARSDFLRAEFDDVPQRAAALLGRLER